MKTERYTLTKPYPRFKIVLDGRAVAFSIGKFYFRLAW